MSPPPPKSHNGQPLHGKHKRINYSKHKLRNPSPTTRGTIAVCRPH